MAQRDCQIVKAVTEDISSIVSLENFLNPSVSWSASTFRKILADPNYLVLVAKLEGKIVGYLVAQRVGDEAELHDIAVVVEHRRKGVGMLLVKKLLEEAKPQKIFLLVRASNLTAQKFYQRLGFHQSGIRKGYYNSPAEDGWIFCLFLPLEV